MLPAQKIFAIIVSALFFLLIIELVRRRRLREEYSWVWLLLGLGILLPVLWYDLLIATTKLIGAVVPTTTLFLFALLALLMLCLYMSVKLSMLANNMKRITQEVAILRLGLDEKNRTE